MLEAAFRGGKRYWGLLGVWMVLIMLGLWAWSQQFVHGLTVTGMTQDVTWGIYIAQFTFLVGVAASAVMVVLPYYLHNHKAFGRMVILGEGLAVAAVIMCMLFIFVDMGQPTRVVNVLLSPHPELHDVLGHDGPGGLPGPEPHHRCRDLRRRAEGGPATQLDQAHHHHLHPLGGEHPHGDGVPLLGPGGPGLLDDGHPGPPVPGFRLRLGAQPPHPSGPHHAEVHEVRPGRHGHPEAGPHRGLRHDHQRLLRGRRALHGPLQRHAPPRPRLPVPLPGPLRAHVPGALDVDGAA
jgi:hypothetical protein